MSSSGSGSTVPDDEKVQAAERTIQLLQRSYRECSRLRDDLQAAVRPPEAEGSGAGASSADSGGETARSLELHSSFLGSERSGADAGAQVDEAALLAEIAKTEAELATGGRKAYEVEILRLNLEELRDELAKVRVGGAGGRADDV